VRGSNETEADGDNMLYIIGVVVVVLAIWGYLRLA
jgi:hypothetical protein